MSPNFHTDKNGKVWVSLREAGQRGPYGAEYLSLLARQRKLLARKIDDVWYTTEEALSGYIKNREETKVLARRKDADVIVPTGAPIENLGYLLNFGNEEKIKTGPQGQTLSIDSQGLTFESKNSSPAIERRKEVWINNQVQNKKSPNQILNSKSKFSKSNFLNKTFSLSSYILLGLISLFSIAQHITPDMVVEYHQQISYASQLAPTFVADLLEGVETYRTAFTNGKQLAQVQGRSLHKSLDSVRHSVSNTQLAAVSFFDSFRSLKDLALKKFFFATTQTKQTSPRPLLGKERETVPPQGPTLSIDSKGRTLKPEQSALTQSTPVLNLDSLRSDLRTELQSYIETRLQTINTPALRQEILLADTRPSVTRQSSSDTSHLSSALTSSLNSLTTGGTFTDSILTNATVSGPTGSFTNFSFSLATGTSATTTSFYSTTASSTNLYSSLATFGTLTVSGATTLGGSLSVSGNTTTIGQLLSTRIPTLAHVFSPWPTGTSNASDATIYINPASAAADTNIFAAAVAGSVKFLVDAEGDIYGNNLVLTGSTSQGETTIAGNLSIQDNTILGDASSDTATFNAQLLAKASTTLQNFTFVNATGTSATTTNFFSTTASSTNLFSSALTVKGYSFTVNGAPTLNDWFDQSVKTTASPSFSNITTTTLGTFANILATASSTLQNFTFNNATGTSATTTNFFATTASSTNLFTTTGNIGTLTASSLCLSSTCNTAWPSTFDFTVTSYGVSTSTTIGFLNGFLSTASSTLTNFTFSTATGTSATTTNFFSTTASSTNLFFTTGTGGTFTVSGTGTFNNILANASSTFQNFTFNNATGTSATTTNFFSTTASSTNLFSSSATFGSASISGALTLRGITYTLPSADGTSGQVLQTDGAGVLSWATKTEGISQDFKGLSLRTHPNAEMATTSVYLDHADEIVMDTGNRVATWDDLSANIATSGAGGLDTGSEAASTWYEIYAIRKSSDGTKNLLLHRAKDYFFDEGDPSNNSATNLRDDAARTKVGQTFDTDETGYVEFIDMKLTKVASPTGRIWMELFATSGSAPTGAVIATSDKLDVSLISTSEQRVRFVFRSPVSLTAGTTYALALAGDFTISAVNYVLSADNNADVYAAGAEYRYDGAAWNVAARDLWFKVYVTRNNTSVTMPSGYDQKAQVGWVYNDGSSNFYPFTATNHFVKLLTDSRFTVTATVATLTDASAFLPPGSLVVDMTGFQDTAGKIVQTGGVPNGYDGNQLGRSGTVWSTAGGAFDAGMAGRVATEYQGLYVKVDGGTGYPYVSGFEWGSGGGADVAEEYLVEDQSIAPGDVVSIAQQGSLYIERAEASSTQPVFGIVSTKPGLRLSDFDRPTNNNRAVALNGRVPVKISEENGPINTGDRLTLSKTKPGFAMKQTLPGQSIGMALESSGKCQMSNDKCQIMTFLNISYWIPPVSLTLNTGTSTATSTSTTTDQTFSETVLDNLMSYIIGVFRDVFNIVFEQGLLKVAHVIADKLTTKELCIEDVCVNKTQLQSLLLNAGVATSTLLDSAASNGASASNESETNFSEVIIEESSGGIASSTEEVITGEESATTTEEVIVEEPPVEEPPTPEPEPEPEVLPTEEPAP